MGSKPEEPDFIDLICYIDDAGLSPSETGVSIQSWTSVWRADTPESTVNITDLIKGDHSDNFIIRFPIPRGMGRAANPWPADAAVWFEAHTFAPSVEQFVVGGRAGSASVSLRDIKSRLVGGMPVGTDKPTDHNVQKIAVTLRMPQVPTREGGFPKMTLVITGFADAKGLSLANSWVCDNVVSRYDFTSSQLALHDSILENYANVLLYPNSEGAMRRGVNFPATHKELEQIHAPFWVSNIIVPMWAFFVQTTRPVYNKAMRSFLSRAATITLDRHDIDQHDFVVISTKQLLRMDDEYDDDFTYMVAAVMDACALLATSTFYRFDEAFEIKQRWFREPRDKKTIIESFHDALRETGGDCEDLGSQIHRVFRWLQMGDPTLKDPKKYWNEYGGWGGDELLDTMQHIMYWYVSGGSLGSVTSARFKAEGGVPRDLFIDSPVDRSLEQGGHMWQESMPVVKVEELMRRMNPNGVPDKALRPKYPHDEYPQWIKFMPHTVGEGTGAIYPLVLPLPMYMHSKAAKKAARVRHENLLNAMQILHSNTKVLGGVQIQRFSNHADSVPDARVNLFYRQTTQFTTDDMALHGIPRFDLIWTQTSPRIPDLEDDAASSKLVSPHPYPIPHQQNTGRQRRIDNELISVPGGLNIETETPPTWGVDMRDKLIALNYAHNDGHSRSNVALTVSPELTTEEIISFKSRIKHLSPWQQPNADQARVDQINKHFRTMINDFVVDVNSILEASRRGRKRPATRVNVIFRRAQFTIPNLRKLALMDIHAIRRHVTKATVAVEVLDVDVYNVRLSLWIANVK